MRKFKWFLQCSQRRNYSRIKIPLLLPCLWQYSSRGHFIGHLYCNLPHRLLLHLVCSYYLPYKRKICCCISCGIVHLLTNLDYPVLFFSSANHSLPARLFPWCMGENISELSVSHLQIFNLQSISIVSQKNLFVEDFISIIEKK